MDEIYTVEFECLACGSAVCMHSNVDMTKQLAYLFTSNCPGCGNNGYLWRLKDIRPYDSEEDGGSEVDETKDVYVN